MSVAMHQDSYEEEICPLDKSYDWFYLNKMYAG